MSSPLHPLALVETFELGCDHLSVRLRAASGFDFVAGQWANLLIPTAGGNERRALSFASPLRQHLREVIGLERAQIRAEIFWPWIMRLP